MQKDKECTRLLYGKETYFELLILETLYKSDAGFTMRELTKLLGRERRTIYKDIEQINQYGLRVCNEKLIIRKRDNRYIVKGDKKRYFEVRIVILENSFMVQFVQELLEKRKVNMHDFCRHFYLSESMLRRYIFQANLLLKKYKINLYFHKNIIDLRGEELQIRHALAAFFWLTYRGMKWPFNLLIKKDVNFLLENLLGKMARTIPQGKKEQLAYILGVSLSRFKNGSTYSLEEFPEEVEMLSQIHPLYQVIRTNNHELSQIEQKGFFAFLITLPEVYLHIDENHQKELSMIKTKFYNLRQQYYLRLKEYHPEWVLNLDKECNKKFMAVLLAGEMNYLLFKGRAFSITGGITREYLNHNFHNLYSKIGEFVCYSNTRFSQEEQEYFVFIYTWAYSMVFELYDFEPELHILLATDMPLHVENNIQHTLEKFLSSKYRVHIHLPGEYTNNYDFILTTCPFSYVDSAVRIVTIEEELTPKNFLNIWRCCGEARIKRKIQKSEK